MIRSRPESRAMGTFRFHRANIRRVAMFMLVACTLPNFGCWYSAKYVTPQRSSQGYVIILPGIEGASYWNASIAGGLVDGGVPAQIEVYDWTLTCAMWAANLMFYWRNEQEALKVVQKIVSYQDLHPGKPVHLIGHSGGGGIAVLALERLPAGRQISSALLLAPAIAPDYNLRRALYHTQHGIWNYYSPYDVGFLGAGTLVMGTIEGKHTRAAGNVGFTAPATAETDLRHIYATKIHQQPYTREMSRYGHDGGHGGWASRAFVRQYLAPILRAQALPTDSAEPRPFPR